MSRRPRNSTGAGFFAWDGDTLVVNIPGKPGSMRDAIGKPLGTQLRPTRLPEVLRQAQEL